MPLGLPKLPSLPRLPRLSSLLRDSNPLRDVLDDGRELIRSAREELHSVVSVLHVDRPVAPSIEREETTVGQLEAATPTSGVTDAETLQYQNENLIDELAQLETLHLPQGGKIMGRSCDCIAKHARAVKRLARETIPIAARQGQDPAVYSTMAEWAEEMVKIGTKAAVDSGQYTERYPKESGEASKFRKAVESGGGCPTCGEPKRLGDFLKRKKKEAKDG